MKTRQITKLAAAPASRQAAATHQYTNSNFPAADASHPQSIAASLVLTSAPIEAAAARILAQREFVRLPRAGELEPHTGLGRSFLNTLILPCAANNFHPVVRSISLRRPGHKFGVRLIDYPDLIRWIQSHASE